VELIPVTLAREIGEPRSQFVERGLVALVVMYDAQPAAARRGCAACGGSLGGAPEQLVTDGKGSEVLATIASLRTRPIGMSSVPLTAAGVRPAIEACACWERAGPSRCRRRSAVRSRRAAGHAST